MVTKSKGLVAAEICLIIESSSKHQVSVLKFGDLYLRFGPQASPQETVMMPEPSTPGVEIPEPDHAKINEATLRSEEAELRLFQIEELKLTNPLEYEELVRNEGIEDADDEPGDLE